MLRSLHITNYAIIDEIEIKFDPRLNIITGETGAGKSILMGALSLILGERADTSVLQNRDRKCVIEGCFTAADRNRVTAFLKENELDIEDELVLRREIAASGKSRAFINDTPATVVQLKQLASLLVDLHQQFDTIELGDADFQRQVLDALAGNQTLLLQYQQQYQQWQQRKKSLEHLQQQKAGFLKELDYNQFLFDELNEVNLHENELETLDEELKMLSNAENIKQTLTQAQYLLSEQDQPIVQQLKVLAAQLQGAATYVKELPALIERISSAQLELQDVAQELERMNEHISFDQQRIDQVNDKLSAGYKLLKKHGVLTTNELLAIQQNLQQKLQQVLQVDDEIANLEAEVAELLTHTKTSAQALTQRRKQQVAPLVENVNSLLARVGMPNARIQVQVNACEPSAYGADNIELLFDANKSNRFEPLRKVASGGELSRLMLCIKSLVAESMDLPTLIFDEIDTGISGEAAKQVGLIMKDLTASRQVICITHQPQIAGKADAHYYVYKHTAGEVITTSIRLLNRDERITSIAQMLSGEKPTAAAIENAREMVIAN